MSLMARELALSGVSTTSEFGDGECSKESAWCAWVSSIRVHFSGRARQTKGRRGKALSRFGPAVGPKNWLKPSPSQRKACRASGRAALVHRIKSRPRPGSSIGPKNQAQAQPGDMVGLGLDRKFLDGPTGPGCPRPGIVSIFGHVMEVGLWHA
jgi:hypothetical protein